MSRLKRREGVRSKGEKKEGKEGWGMFASKREKETKKLSE